MDMEMDKLAIVTTFLHNIVVYNIPLLYGTTGEIVVEKSGSLNLGVEGIMAVGAIFGYLAGCYANSLGAGILTAFLMGALCGLIFAVLTVSLQANQNITGLTLTTFGLGVYFFVGNGVRAVSWPAMNDYASIKEGFADLAIPGLSQIPVIGRGLFDHNILVYLGVVIALVLWWYLSRTTPGLRLRAVGENPGAADSVGINLKKYQYIHICLGCGIMGIGGYYMALNMSGSFNSSCWINGYGWIAVALVIFANWNPALAILGTFVFGFFNTLRVSGSSLAAAFPDTLGWLAAVPTQLYQALPFLITAVVLVATSVRKKGSSGQPASLGLNYFREERLRSVPAPTGGGDKNHFPGTKKPLDAVHPEVFYWRRSAYSPWLELPEGSAELSEPSACWASRTALISVTTAFCRRTTCSRKAAGSSWS